MWIVQSKIFAGLTILSDFTNANSLSCISMNNQECKTRPQVIDVNGDEPVFFPFSTEVNVVVGVIILTIHMQTFVFLIL